MHKHSRPLFALVLFAALTLLACQTTDLISGVTQNNARPPATRITNRNNPTDENPGDGNPAGKEPAAEYDYDLAGTPRCTVGDNAASIVTGQVLDKGNPVMGQQIQASSGEGGEPISDPPAESDSSGNFQVTFVCGGSACNGSFWVWLIDDEGVQVSPFVQFVFDNQCRRGTVNFTNP